MAKPHCLLLAVLVLAGAVAAADCAYNAYRESCSGCSFDAGGKMDSACSGAYKAKGTACASASYPIASASYAQGKCPAIDDCASELSSCTSQYKGGNDKEDCQAGELEVCFRVADECMRQAAVKCGETAGSCPSGTGLVLLLALAGFAKFSSGKDLFS